jgi:flagellin
MITMSVVINTNYAATVASNNLASSNGALQRSLNRLSSGSKIVSPSDDAGGLAVSMKLASASKRQGAVNNNIGNAVSFLQTQDGALKVAGKILDRMSELKTLYEDATKNSSDQANYDTEFKALSKQLESITSEKFNGISLFSSGANKTIYATEDLSTSTSISLVSRDLASTGTGLGTLSSGGNVSMTSSAVTIDVIKTAIENVATMRAANGAEQSRLSFAGELLTVNKANLEAANSRITDVDVAQESTQLARWNILVQSGTAMLAQANQTPQVALKLLG